VWHTLIKSKTIVIPEIFTYFSTLEIYKYDDLKSFYAFSIKFKARDLKWNETFNHKQCKISVLI